VGHLAAEQEPQGQGKLVEGDPKKIKAEIEEMAAKIEKEKS
jgi:hypothetical protein